MLLTLFFRLPSMAFAQGAEQQLVFDFYGESITIPYSSSSFVDFAEPLAEEKIYNFYKKLNATGFDSIVVRLLTYKKEHQVDDWVYYQLVRRTAQHISPKGDNYIRYTLYKWYLLSRSGYDATLAFNGDKLLFYIQCNEEIFDIPFYAIDGKKYVCLNYHDYGSIDFDRNAFTKLSFKVPGAGNTFSYKLTQLPSFRPDDYVKKELEFKYYHVNYKFEVKVNEQVKQMLANYPVTDYKAYFDAPLSKETYTSLIPQLKKGMKGLSVKNGVDYLMRFTRDAFSYQPDAQNFGKEKRLFPEQTLLYEHSDCEDRAALFFYLVKEVYNLPMIVLAYPNHVTVAVKFDKPVGKPIVYNGVKYSICEPTPQGEDLSVGEISSDLRKQAYEVAYVYNP
ncbi:MAG: hypothetical protein EOP56_16025 [Sphingobacteriales bacterium]|nr:MAG: hypothetical protein EOP56_16025 [Sphingobacteriales bacterium]